MPEIALDVSVAVAWVLDDEHEPYADATFSVAGTEGALVPSFWHIELRNVLLIAERRARLSPARSTQHLRRLAALPIQTDDATDIDAAYLLAQTYGLTIYDAVYLELAVRRNAVLSTLDNALRRAAQSETLLWQP